MEEVKAKDIAKSSSRQESANIQTSLVQGIDLSLEISEKIISQIGYGERLPHYEQRKFELVFEKLFYNVRIHDNEISHELNDILGSKAFTVGSDIFFAKDQYQPETEEGRELIKHELTHVIQQDNTKLMVQRMGCFFQNDEELVEYLKKIVKLSRKKDIKKRILSSSHASKLAKEIILRWKNGHSHFVLTTTMKISLIHELWESIERATFFYESESFAILDLLEGSSPREVKSIMNSEIFKVDNQKRKKKFDEYFRSKEKYSERYTKILDSLIKMDVKYANKKNALNCDSVWKLKEAYHYNAKLPDKPDNQNDIVKDKEYKKKCIQILFDTSSNVFGKKPNTGRPPIVGGKRGWTMGTFSKKLHFLGKSSPTYNFKFDGANGIKEPKKLKKSVVDKINDLIDNKIGWHIFGITYLNSYHACLILVDKRFDGKTYYYWLDQWRDARQSDNADLEGSISGFRLYKGKGIDKHIEYFTNYFWMKEYKKSKKEVEEKKRKKTLKLNATVSLWKFYPGK